MYEENKTYMTGSGNQSYVEELPFTPYSATELINLLIVACGMLEQDHPVICVDPEHPMFTCSMSNRPGEYAAHARKDWNVLSFLEM